jgi:hypothetical protein
MAAADTAITTATTVSKRRDKLNNLLLQTGILVNRKAGFFIGSKKKTKSLIFDL